MATADGDFGSSHYPRPYQFGLTLQIGENLPGGGFVLAASRLDLHHAGTVAYPIAFGTKADTSGLERLAHETGGSYHAAASSGTLSAIYSSIASELQRTWRLRYLTSARPGDKLQLKAPSVLM